MPRSEIRDGLAVLDRYPGTIPLAVGGLPSPESIFTIHCVAEILRRTRGQAHVFPLNTKEDCEKLAEAPAGEPVVPFFDTPDSKARQMLQAMRVPVVVVTGDFVETARFCMIARDLEDLQAARFVSQSFSCLAPLQQQDNVRWIALDVAANLTEWIDEVAAWLGLQPVTWQAARQQMLAEYAAWSTVEAAILALVHFSDRSSAAWDRLPASPQPLFETLGASYHSGLIDTVFWPADCILEPGDPAFPVVRAIPLVGPGRMLTFGPFLHLPPGRWTARYQFEVDDHPAGNLMEFDVLNGSNILVSHRTMVDSAGKFGFDCEFEMEEARLAVENRAILVEGALGGFFKPIGISLVRIA